MIGLKQVVYLVAVCISSSIVGCGSDKVASTGTSSSSALNIYIAGFQENAANVKVATLWKNGVATALTDGTNNAIAYSVAIEGEDVYVCGLESNGSNNVVEVWKNGAETALTDGTLQGSRCSIAVSNNDVYVAGGQSGYDSGDSYIDQAGYWKNGNFVTLLASDSSGQNGGSTNAIVVQNGDVYVVGNKYETIVTGGSAVVNPVPTYWKNGLPVVLTSGIQYASAYSLAVSGTDVFVGGAACAVTVPDCQNAVYWRDGIMTQLSSAADGAVSGIAVSGANVFSSSNITVGGSIQAAYWTNGTQTILDQSPVSAANGITLSSSDDIYVVGSQEGGACYWKNGVLHSVTNGVFTSAGYAIAVAQE